VKRTDIHKAVRERYAALARQEPACCAGTTPRSGTSSQERTSKALGYTEAQLRTIPAGADLGLGCGNPTALVSLGKGEVVLDLGSGAGIDCFLAANAVGKTGKVIGVDMTAEMIERARATAKEGGYPNVEFRLGEIENLPVADNSVDVVISNCVINLSPDKGRVFEETYRVLRPGGRLMVSDIVLRRPLPETIRSSIEAYVGCVAGASLLSDYLAAIEAVGFQGVEVVSETSAEAAFPDAFPQKIADDTGVATEVIQQAADAVISVSVWAEKPLLHEQRGQEIEP